jgi:hypothetical protein
VYAGQELGKVFEALHVAPDFDYTKPSTDTHLEFVHRKLPGADIYFVDNRGDGASDVDATFRVAGREPALWYAETGATKPVSFKVSDGRTTVPLHLEPWGTVFVVFERSTKQTAHELPKMNEAKVADVAGPWTVTFEQGRGAPPTTTVDQLASWSDSADPGIKYFSGEGTYTKTVQASGGWFAKGAHLWLDLGDVKNLARVSVNGKDLGVVWHAPYRVDVTSALKPGANELKVKVVNAWVNRLIGDQQPGATAYTFADVKPYKANSPLLPSGLLGPVAFIRTN